MHDRYVFLGGRYADLCSSSRVMIVNARLSKSGNRGGDQSLGRIAVVPYGFYFWMLDWTVLSLMLTSIDLQPKYALKLSTTLILTYPLLPLVGVKDVFRGICLLNKLLVYWIHFRSHLTRTPRLLCFMTFLQTTAVFFPPFFLRLKPQRLDMLANWINSEFSCLPWILRGVRIKEVQIFL